MRSVVGDLLGSPGLRFWWRTFEGVQDLFAEGHGEEGGPDDPLPVKTYRGLARYVLPGPARRIGDARWSFGSFRAAHPSAVPQLDALDERALSTLLYWTYGLGRIELGPHAVWPYHRMVASARCFHPVELYLWLARPVGGLPAGCYHYDPAHHALTLLRPGGVPREVRAASGTGAGVGLLVASAWFRKSAFRYRDYAYRLCAQEAGMVVGNALLAAGAIGVPGRVHHRFDDATVNRALGLDGVEETAFAVVDLGAADWPVGPPGPSAGLPEAGRVPEIRLAHLSPNATNADAWSGLTALDLAARMSGPGAPVDPADFLLPLPAPGPAGVGVPGAGAEPGGVELAGALRVRDSGGRMFLPAGPPPDVADLVAALRYAWEPVPGDHTGSACPPLVDAHVLVVDAAGIAPGWYRLAGPPGAASLVRAEDRDGREVVAMLCDRTPAVNSAKAGAVVFLTADRLAGERWFGARGYRVLHQEAGIVAQRVSVFAAAAGLSARVTNGYHDGLVRESLGVDAARVPVFTVVLGRRRPTAQYEPPLTW
ncbi:SagB family peptide dehydrogenase [Streptomyces sp. NBC_01435]|uniref:SagB family peptide dehydrogenase n=1 Tax=Streptomyces sp. NBC_01435 TaxID=2903865 RepID=UPI002E3242A9|nr:SagB family peptide dehydrogenase [Streptomyces sp. NBC_01435]